MENIFETKKHHAAFPTPDTEGMCYIPGLTKQEYFAAMALQGLTGSGVNSRWTADKIAESSVELANLLIQALNK